MIGNKKLLILIFAICIIENSYSTDVNETDERLSITPQAIEAMSNPNYLVTSGDVYELTYLAGSHPVIYKIVADNTYTIRVSNLSTINVKGLTFSQLKKQVENIVIKNYPMSGVQFILISPGIFNVYVKGEVKEAFHIKTTALTNLSSILNDTLTPYSSTRDIEIISSSGKKREFDLFKAMRYGDFSQNPFLRPGDTVNVKRLKRKVTISGCVERPGTYQLLDGENIQELIETYGGGLKEFANNSKITITSHSKSPDFPLGNSFVLTAKEDIDSYQIKNFDEVYIEDSFKLKNIIYFEGAIENNEKQPICAVLFNTGDDLVSVVRKNRTLFSSLSDVKNAYLIRKNKKIFENFDKIFYDINYDEKIILEAEDRIIVPSLQQIVTVAGAVINPGSYPYVPGKTYEYYIAVAGGFNTSQNDLSKVVIKNSLGKKLAKTDYILPDSIITAKTNSFSYHFNKYAPIITAISTIITAVISILTFTYGRNRLM